MLPERLNNMNYNVMAGNNFVAEKETNLGGLIGREVVHASVAVAGMVGAMIQLPKTVLEAVKQNGNADELNRPIKAIIHGVTAPALVMLTLPTLGMVALGGVILNTVNEQFHNDTNHQRLQHQRPDADRESIQYISCDDWNELL